MRRNWTLSRSRSEQHPQRSGDVGLKGKIGRIWRSLSHQDSQSSEGATGCEIPSDSLVHIFRHPSVDLATLASCRMVCKRWKSLLEDNDILRRKSEASRLTNIIPRSDPFNNISATMPLVSRGKYIYAKGFSDGSVAFNDVPFKAVAATAGICPTHYFHRIHNSPICDVKIIKQNVAYFESTKSRSIWNVEPEPRLVGFQNGRFCDNPYMRGYLMKGPKKAVRRRM